MRVLVIGAGLLGVTSAYFLRRAGAEVTVVDRAAGPGRETSFANGGMLTPSQAYPWNAPGVLAEMLRSLFGASAAVRLHPHALLASGGWGLRFLRNARPGPFRRSALVNARLAAYNLEVLAGLREQLALSYDGARLGTLKVFRESAALEKAARYTEMIAETGVRYHLLDGPGAVAVEPALAPVGEALAGAIHYPDDEAGDAHGFCAALADAAAREGVELRFDMPVRRLVREGERIARLETDEGPLEADAYVLAAGPYSPWLARQARLDLPVRPVKGYSLTLPGTVLSPWPTLPVVDEALHVAVNPLGARLRVAGMAEIAGWNTRIPPRRIAHLLRMLRRLYPAYDGPLDVAAVQPWTGLRPLCCDDVPVIGRSPVENLYLNTGHGHLGWSMAAGSGRLLADLMTGSPPALDPGPFSIARFDASRASSSGR